MINVIIDSGLGNSLFQYAVGRHLAIKNNSRIRTRFSVHKYLNKHDILGLKSIKELSFFNIKPVLWPPVIISRAGRPLGTYWSSHSDRVYHEKGWGFHPEVLELKDGVYLHGFFQSEKYFKDIEQTIRNDLRSGEAIFTEEGAVYKDQITKFNSVSIHVRRGDYLTSPLHNVCNIRYYVNSIAYIRNRLMSPHFFVFSDDIEWCHKNLPIPDCTFVNIRESKKNSIIDFQLMSLCKHNIISNSTFSWWAAWLNENPGRIVVAPKRWFNDERMNACAFSDTIPDSWIRIDF